MTRRGLVCIESTEPFDGVRVRGEPQKLCDCGILGISKNSQTSVGLLQWELGGIKPTLSAHHHWFHNTHHVNYLRYGQVEVHRKDI